jgi:membrane-associated phospholipid phosphatase
MQPQRQPLPDGEISDPWAAPVPRWRYLGVLAVQYALWLAAYLGVNAATAGRSAAQPFLPFEDRIPLIAAAYPVYASVYLEIVLPLWLARTRRAFVRTQLAVTLASLLAFAVFLAAPMPYPRPVLDTHDAMHGLLALEWAVDGPRCTFPSLHVAIAMVMYLGLRNEAPRWRLPLLFVAIGVSISTVLVKQHFIADVVGGVVLAAIAWRLTLPVMAWLGIRARGA